jgi:hypothetical protein
MYEGKYAMYGGNMEIIAISEIYKFLASVYFPSRQEETWAKTFVMWSSPDLK